ncbi:hypothetical protein [Nesterenkonia populi]|uniref:hypothetical protein n=1 Tax=Nesterenkonia populi TaxID=1591087 RepID=UPI0011BDB8C4|nr:hypothetical protein [Nesterenkonia populi]
MAKKKKSSWEHKLLAGVETATDWTAPKVGAAADWAEKTYRKSAPKVQDASAKVLYAVEDGAYLAGGQAKKLAAKAGDGVYAQYDKLPKSTKKDIEKVLAKYEGAKADVRKKYVPAAAGQLSGYANKTAKLIHKAEVDPRVEKALIKATGDKKIVKKLRKNSEKAAKKASKELKKQSKTGGKKKALLVFGVVAAGVTAGVAAWRASKPVEDPWKKPEPVKTTEAEAQKPAAAPAAKQAETNQDTKPAAAEVPSPKPATE